MSSPVKTRRGKKSALDSKVELSEPSSAPTEKVSSKKKKKDRSAKQVSEEEEVILPFNETTLDYDYGGDEEVEAAGLDQSSIWSKDDMLILVDKIRAILPTGNPVKYSSTLKEIKWADLVFGDHSEEDVKLQCTSLIKKVRTFRTLEEVTEDIATYAKTYYPKLNKHPDHPKKPLTPYLVFWKNKCRKLRAQFPHIGVRQMAPIVSKEFKEISESKRAKLQAKYDAQNEIWKQKMRIFKEQHPELGKARNDSRKLDKLVHGIEKTASPFILFKDEKSRKEPFKSMSGQESLIQLRKLWHDLVPGKKVKWIRKALEDEKRFKDQAKQMSDENPELEFPPFRSALSRSELLLKDKYDGRPDKPPSSGYTLYSQVYMKEHESEVLPNKDKMIVLAKSWNELPTEEKEAYNSTAKQMTQQYRELFASYMAALPAEDQERILREQGRKLLGKGVTGVGKRLKNNQGVAVPIVDEEEEEEVLQEEDINLSSDEEEQVPSQMVPPKKKVTKEKVKTASSISIIPTTPKSSSTKSPKVSSPAKEEGDVISKGASKKKEAKKAITRKKKQDTSS